MKHIYLDNASTSFPKAPGVARAMAGYLEKVGCNVNRGEYDAAYGAAEMALDTRERLCALFGFSRPENVIFAQNVTMALNMVLKGLLRPGDHALVSAMEHNAVMRPLTQLAERGVAFDRAPCSGEGELLPDRLEPLFRPNTRAVVMTHASNVCGTLLPIREVGELCRRRGVFFVVDCAQTAGVLPIAMEEWCIDALCFTGHKGLLGPQGTGGFLAGDRLMRELVPLLSGGTGSFSDLETVPELTPDRFEAGTPNLPGIYGLNAALRFLGEYGVGRIREEERALTGRFLRRIGDLPGVRVVGVRDPSRQAAVVSLDFTGRDNAEIAYRLDSEYGVLTRCGLHCAPNAHRTLGTFPQGTVRFSMGHGNTPEEIDRAADAVRALAGL